MKKIFLFVIAALCFTFSFTKAQTIDNFNYSGSLTSNGWTAHSGGGTNAFTTTTGLAYTGYIASGIGYAAIMGGTTGGEDVNYTPGVGSYSTNGTSVYFSVMVNIKETNTRTGDYIIHLGNRSSATSFTSFCARVYAKITSSSVYFGIASSSTAVYGTTAFSANTTYLLVVKYTINTSGSDTASLWVISSGIPYSESIAGTPEATSTASGLDIVNAFALRQGTSGNYPLTAIDGIRLSTSWADVMFTPAISAASNVASTTFKANWGAVTDATGYYLDVATDASFTSFVTGYNNVDVGNVTSTTLTGLTEGQTYYYRVRAYSALGTGANSGVTNITTVSMVLSGTEAAALGYTENDAATSITSTTALACLGLTNLAGAVIQITGNYKSDQDVLSFTDADGITGSWNSTTGTLTLSGSSAYANYQTALRNVKYQNTSESPNTLTRTVSFSVNDGTTSSNTATRNISITSVPDIPVLSSLEAAAIDNVAGNAAQLTSAVAVSDLDNTTLTGATIQITGNYSSGQDVLSFTNDNGITGSWSSSTGTMTLSGTAALAYYQNALRSIYFQTASSSASALTRTITFIVTDGANSSVAVTRDINVDNAPVIASIETASLTYNTGDAATVISSTLTTSDYDNTSLTSAIVKFSSYYQTGYDVLSFTDADGITGSWNSTTGILTLSGSSSVANYQSALRSIKYQNTSSAPVKLIRTISFTVNDGTTNSNTATRNIDLGYQALSINSIETDTLVYKQTDGEKNVTSSLSINCPSTPLLNGATIAITGNYVKGEDVLVCASQNQIVSVWNANTGTIELTWPSSVANYETALRSLTYKNTGTVPTAGARIISFTVTDGYNTSNTLTRTVRVSVPRTITVTASNTSGGTVSGGGSIYSGNTATVTAVTNTGYTFAGWSENGTIIATTPSYSFVVSVDRTLTAMFTINQYVLSITVSPTSGGTVSGAGSYDFGSSVTAAATPASGYEFLNWTDGANILSTSASYTFNLNSSINLTANFRLLPVLKVSSDYVSVGSTAGTATITVSNSGGGTLNWTAVSDIFWLKINSGASGTNSGTISISYSNNNSIARTGTITITAEGVSGSPKKVEIRQGQSTTGVESLSMSIPTSFKLDQNYPNPFNPSTKIRFGLPKESKVTVTIYNMLGEEVAKVVDGEYGAGYYEINFNAGNLSSGFYMYVITAGEFFQAKKMVLTK